MKKYQRFDSFDISSKDFSLRSFEEVPQEQREYLFQAKCVECIKVFQVNDSKIVELIKSKLTTEIIDFISYAKNQEILRYDSYKIFMKMISTILFQYRRYITWEYLNIIYNTLFLCKYCPLELYTSSFIYKLIKNGISSENEEREIVRDILISIQRKHKNIQKQILHSIFMLLSLRKCSNEIFEVLFSIISNNSFELQRSHLYYFRDYFLPFHLNQIVHPMYIECVISFCKKEYSLFPIIFGYLLNHWPVTDFQKEILFLNEMTKLFITFVDVVSFEMATAYFERIALSLQSVHCEIVNTAIKALKKREIQNLLKQFPQMNYHNITSVIEKISISHWNTSTRCKCFELLSSIWSNETDIKISINRNNENVDDNANQKWGNIFRVARRRDPRIQVKEPNFFSTSKI